MHNELRYQAKIHTISKKLSKEKRKEKKDILWEKETISSPSMWGKIKPVLRERSSELLRQKSSDVLSLSSP
jgi:hypothetical protein